MGQRQWWAPNGTLISAKTSVCPISTAYQPKSSIYPSIQRKIVLVLKCNANTCAISIANDKLIVSYCLSLEMCLKCMLRKMYVKTSKTMSDKLNKLLLKRLRKTISSHYQHRNSLHVQSFSQFESRDVSRCKRRKSYSFCGSHTTTHIHWYYNRRQNRCQPYTYCELVDNIPAFNTENNFYSETECNKLCVQ